MSMAVRIAGAAGLTLLGSGMLIGPLGAGVPGAGPMAALGILVLLIAAIGAAAEEFTAMHEQRRGLIKLDPDVCAECGYDLSRLPSDRCPECGTARHAERSETA